MLSGKGRDRPLHGIERNLAGSEGTRALVAGIYDAGRFQRAQRLRPTLTPRRPLQQLVAQVPLFGRAAFRLASGWLPAATDLSACAPRNPPVTSGLGWREYAVSLRRQPLDLPLWVWRVWRQA